MFQAGSYLVPSRPASPRNRPSPIPCSNRLRQLHPAMNLAGILRPSSHFARVRRAMDCSLVPRLRRACRRRLCRPSTSRRRLFSSRLDRWHRNPCRSGILDRSIAPRASRPPDPRRHQDHHRRPCRCRSARRLCHRRSGLRRARSVRHRWRPRRGLGPCRRDHRRRCPVHQIGRQARKLLRRRRIRRLEKCPIRRPLRRQLRRHCGATIRCPMSPNRRRLRHCLDRRPSRAAPKSRRASWHETSGGCDCGPVEARA